MVLFVIKCVGGWRNYGRFVIGCDEVLVYCRLSDELGDGHIFHHRYVNGDGEVCENLTPLNTVPTREFGDVKGMKSVRCK